MKDFAQGVLAGLTADAIWSHATHPSNVTPRSLLIVGVSVTMLWLVARKLVLKHRTVLRFLWWCAPPGNDLRKERPAHAEDAVQGFASARAIAEVNGESYSHSLEVVKDIIGTSGAVAAAWWNDLPLVVAGAAEAIGSVVFTVGATRQLGASLILFEALLIVATVIGVYGVQSMVRWALVVSASLLVSECGASIALHTRWTIDNDAGYVAILFWVVGLALCLRELLHPSSRLNQWWRWMLVVGMFADAFACLADVPRFLVGIHVNLPLDGTSWFNLGPLPGLLLLSWVLLHVDITPGLREAEA